MNSLLNKQINVPIMMLLVLNNLLGVTEAKMNRVRLGGWALTLSAMIGLLGSVWFGILQEPSPTPLTLVWILGAIFLILGVPAIQSMQPRTGTQGQVGLGLMAIAALLAIAVNLVSRVGGMDVGGVLPLLSALAGIIGRLIVGWVTIRARVFPSWIGWLLILSAVLSALADAVLPGVLVFATIRDLVDAAAIAGYGLTILQRQIPISSRGI
jgi:hypothetical protein